MRVTDILGLPLAALWQQKSRTLMTTLGVVFGSFVLAASLSIGQGIQDTIERESRRGDFLRKIAVSPRWRVAASDLSPEELQVSGEMTDAKRERIRQAIIHHKERFGSSKQHVALTQEKLRELASLEHVENVVPVVWKSGYAIYDQQSQYTAMGSARPEDAACRQRLLAGRFFDSPQESTAVVSELLLYRWGLTDDASVQKVLGKKLRVELRSQWQKSGFILLLNKPNGQETTLEETAAVERVKGQLPTSLEKFDLTPIQLEVLRKNLPTEPPSTAADSLVAEEFTIVGVVREPTDDERSQRHDMLWVETDVILPFQTALNFSFRLPGEGEQGVNQAVVIVDREQHVKEVLQRVKDSGLEGYAFLEFIDQQRLMYLLIFAGMTCVATVALLVAALGIANTMLMSVLERTREIGIMKAVGASNAQLLFIFLVEGAVIGLVGGGLGLLLAWASSYPGDAWVRSMVTRDLKIELKEALFVFPFWLTLTVLLFAVLVTTLAALYPARRAASVDPVAALRHE